MESRKLYTQEARRLSAQTIFSSIIDGGKTFWELAPEYGVTEDQLKKIIFEKVGPKEYRRLQKINWRNQTSGGGRRKKAVSKKKIKKIATRVNTEEMDIAVFNIPNEIPALDAQLTKISTEIDRLNSAIPKKQELLKSESAKLEKAKKAFEEAKKQLAIVQKHYSISEMELFKLQSSLLREEKYKGMLEEKFAELQSKQIFLVAPNYRGEIPQYGTVVAVTAIPGTTLEDVSKVELMQNVSADEVFCFKNMEEAEAVCNYLRLVMKYFCEDKEYTLLVDDENIITLLKKHELIE